MQGTKRQLALVLPAGTRTIQAQDESSAHQEDPPRIAAARQMNANGGRPALVSINAMTPQV